MATQYISAVRYDSEGKHITHLAVSSTLDSSTTTTKSRAIVVAEIEGGDKYFTKTKNAGTWQRGQEVHVITVNKVKYLRTDQNHREGDNLGSLPTF